MLKKNTGFRWFLLILICLGLLSGCAHQKVTAEQPENRDVLYQVSTLNALMLGYYDGVVTVGDLLKEGDTGVGTFDTLDGEMIVLDGQVYQAKADGSVEKKGNDATVPFAAVTYFDDDLTLEDLTDLADIEALKTLLDQKVLEDTDNPNLFYVAKVTGDFSMIHVRSVPAQEKPYKPLKEIAQAQPEFEYKDMKGTIVAVRCPDYVAGINMPGWHLHFISADGTKGGHLLDAALKTGEGQVDFTNEFQMFLPEDVAFGDLSLANDLAQDTQKVEGKQEK